MGTEFSSSLFSPKSAAATISQHFLRVLFPSSSFNPPPFPVKAASWEAPVSPPFPMESSPRNHIACSIGTEGKAGLSLGALSDLFFTSVRETASWWLLQDLFRCYWLAWSHSPAATFHGYLRHLGFFCLTSGRALRLPWSGLFSVWVSFKRGERFVASQTSIEIFQKCNWKHLCFSFWRYCEESKNRQVAIHWNQEVMSSLWISAFFQILIRGRERNGNPLQYSCLENLVDRGAWWAAVHGVAQSQTWLKRLSMHACIGEGNGNPLQCSCLENPRDGGAWWAAVCGVVQSRTRLKQLSRQQ